MTEKMRRDFCIECRKETEYLLQKRDMVKTIKDKSYKFEITVAVCMECGREMSIPGLIDNEISFNFTIGSAEKSIVSFTIFHPP